MRYEKLICISPDSNNNKEYVMSENADGTFTVKYGRVGQTHQTDTYSMSKWQSKFNEKIKKGYIRVTELVSEVKSKDANLTGNQSIDFLLEKLLKASKQAFNATYRVAAASITQAQVNEVQSIINEINSILKVSDNVSDTHGLFVKLWTVLPRVIGNVKAALPKTIEQAKQMLDNEQDSINNAEVQQAFVSEGENKNILDNLGVSISEKLTDIPSDLKTYLSSNIRYVNGIYRVIKPELDQKFLDYVSNSKNQTTQFRYHGTKWRNGMAILQTGLRILGAKSSTYSGSMLGDAIYTSYEFQKSRNYSDGLMFVLNVHTGNPLMVKSYNDIKNYSYDELVTLGYDSVNADPGVDTGWKSLSYHEQTIYHESQHTFLYLLDVGY